MENEFQPDSPELSEASVPSLQAESESTGLSATRVNTPQLPQLHQLKASVGPKNVSYSSSSMTWQSDQQNQREEWLKVKRRLQRMYKATALVPWSAAEWNEHKAAMKQRDIQIERKKIEQREQALMERKLKATNKIETSTQPYEANRMRTVSSGRGVVLGQTTVWCPLSAQRFGGRVWPSKEELRHEGDERVSTGYGRYLPIVRDWHPEHTDIPWDQVRALPPHEFDAVNRPMNRDDIYGERTEIDEDDIPSLLNSDLLAAMDENDFDIDRP